MRAAAITTTAVLLYIVVVSNSLAPARAQSPESRAASPASLVNQYCMGCHSYRLKSGGLALSTLNLGAAINADVGEKVIRKLRGGLMPPGGSRRPDAQTAAEFVSWLENKIDAASTEPHPGRVPLRRLN